MSEQTQIMTVSDRYMPAMSIQAAIERRNAVVDFVRQVMVRDTDFGVIPGTDKPTLLKPGAEKLNTLFGLSSRFIIVEKETDWTGAAHDGEPFFYFVYRCQLWRGDWLMADAEASCNSMEKKYRWRKAERVCPECGKSAIIKGSAQYGGGWLCWKKKDGCGTKFQDNDKRITDQEVGQVRNPDIADQVNTLQKMAQKRALIAATLLAVNASEFFTQDIEDMAIEGDYTVRNPEPEPTRSTPAPTPKQTTTPPPPASDAPANDPLARLQKHKAEAIELVSKLSAEGHETEAGALEAVILNANKAVERKQSATAMHSIAGRLDQLCKQYGPLVTEPAPTDADDLAHEGTENE